MFFTQLPGERASRGLVSAARGSGFSRATFGFAEQIQHEPGFHRGNPARFMLRT